MLKFLFSIIKFYVSDSPETVFTYKIKRNDVGINIKSATAILGFKIVNYLENWIDNFHYDQLKIKFIIYLIYLPTTRLELVTFRVWDGYSNQLS